jgi:hypothetical protein
VFLIWWFHCHQINVSFFCSIMFCLLCVFCMWIFYVLLFALFIVFLVVNHNKGPLCLFLKVCPLFMCVFVCAFHLCHLSLPCLVYQIHVLFIFVFVRFLGDGGCVISKSFCKPQVHNMVKISTKLIGLDCCASMMVLNSIDRTILTKENLFSISNDGPIWLLLPNNEGSKSQKLHSHNMGLVLFILSYFLANVCNKQILQTLF